jgi:cytochrome c-type biogenesis protein CcmF
MIPELGHFSLIIAFVIAIALAIVPFTGTLIHNTALMRYSRPLATGQFVFILISFICLAYSFATDDFSVQYVASNSNSHLPLYYKLSAVWGGHEGSLLLWILILAGWTQAVAIFSKQLPDDILARVLSVMGMISIGFTLFILMTSNPFLRILPNVPEQGASLNPLLQDIGLILHPPMLYMGYVGFSVAFAFAIAALMSGKLDTAWARWSRPWTTVAWMFLTIGIALGSWWAYYELGWGGWWFWDPVENASFMPWLAGTALIHSLAATEKRGVFKSWTVLLAIIAFSLSLLGTFLVRSGVLTSVHAFATDPARGKFVLMLLAITIIGSLTLYAFRAPVVKSRIGHGFFSREMFLLLNNVFLMALMVTVLLGTLYPLVIDYMGDGKISVGPPYFNLLFVPLVSILVILMGVGVFTRWKNTDTQYLIKQLWKTAVLATLLALMFPFLFDGHFKFKVFLGIFISSWLIFVTFKDVWMKMRNKANFWMGVRGLGRSYIGMVLGHLGLAMAIIGVCLVSNYNVERDVRLQPGESVTLANYRFEFLSTDNYQGPNFTSTRSHFKVFKKNKLVALLNPEKRMYTARGMSMTEAGIDGGITRDLFVAMGKPLGEGAWSFRIHYKPFVRWIWLGALVMALGGLFAISDRRYRLQVKAKYQLKDKSDQNHKVPSQPIEAKA